MGSGKKVRLYPDEAKALGITPKPNEPNRKSNVYYVNEQKLEALRILRKNPRVRRLFFDIETIPTVGYFWDIGWRVRLTYDNIIEHWKIVCISYKWGGSDKVETLDWNHSDGEKGMLQDFSKILLQADEVVAHNGDRFDVKKFRTRCVFHRVPTLPKIRTLDTLRKARSSFSFPSNRLNDIGRYLGVGQKIDTNYDLWKRVMAGDRVALAEMIEYCEGDVVLLEDIFTVIKPYIINNANEAVLSGGYKWECPSCGNQDAVLLKNRATRKGSIIRLMECDSCEYQYEISNRSYMAKLKKESGIIP